MNDNNKMDRGKEHAGPKKMTPRQKQKRNRSETITQTEKEANSRGTGNAENYNWKKPGTKC